MEQLGKSLGYVLAKFGLLNCFGIGEGAGADILCRFAVKIFKINFIIKFIILKFSLQFYHSTNPFLDGIPGKSARSSAHQSQFDCAWNYWQH